MDKSKKTLAEIFTDLDNRNPLRLWFMVYGGFFLLAIILAFVSTQVWPSFIFESNSVRYILSALIQSQAAVISIVVTLTLVAVQWTASTYSPRVVEVFKRHPNMWLLLGSYIVSIGFCTLLLSLITGDVSSISLRFSVFFAIYLGIFLFFALIPYILNSMNLLNAEKILIRLSGLISTSKLRAEEDPFQALFDIIYGAIRNYDMTTLSTGLVLARDKFEEIICENNLRGDQKRYLSFRYFDDLKRCGLLLIDRNEERFVFEIINRLNDHGILAVEHNDTGVLIHVNTSLQEIGNAATEKKYESVVENTLMTFEECAKLLNDRPEEKKGSKNNIGNNIQRLIASISDIGQEAVNAEMDLSAGHAINQIKEIWYEYELKRGQSPHLLLSPHLFAIAKSAVNSHNPLAYDYIYAVLFSIESMSTFFLDVGNEEAVIEIMAKIKDFAHFADEKGEKEAVFKSSETIFHIGAHALSRNQKSIVSVAAKYLVLLHSLCPYLKEYRNSDHKKDLEYEDFEKGEYELELGGWWSEMGSSIDPSLSGDSDYEDYREYEDSVIISWSDEYSIE